MEIKFWKYHGTGNDFVMIDDRSNRFPQHDIDLIVHLCHRRFGIGSDGLILIQNHADYDFNMVFFNPDGSQSFCGNGSRCAVAFAHAIGIEKEHYHFLSTDGLHEAYLLPNGEVKLSMHDVKGFETIGKDLFLDTGSPHYIQFCAAVDNLDVVSEGRIIRYSVKYKEQGVNVNFVEFQNEEILVRTYERGVEDETWSCGTGVTAAALATSITHQVQSPVNVRVKGGALKVFFSKQGDGSYVNIWLQGSTQPIFQGVFIS
ncbi:MAG: diaminopimelate epimerase [Flavobacteriales bacterium]